MSKLFNHQNEGIAFLIKKKKAILADEMGLGKTKQAIIAAKHDNEKATLVICPASLKINWKREIGMCYNDLICIIESGPVGKIPVANWYVINYDMLPKYEAQILDLIKVKWIDTIVIDEAHYIKGKSTIRSKTTLAIAEKAERVYCLTGTPVMNRPAELYNLLKAIKHPLGEAKTTYIKRFCGGQMKTLVRDLFKGKTFFVDPSKSYPFRAQKQRYKVYTFVDDTGAMHLPELHKEIQGSILRRTKKEVLDLPEKIISIEVCDLDREWKMKYEIAWDEYIDWVQRNPEGKDLENIMIAKHLVEIGKLKQVCSLAKINRIVADVGNAIEQGEKVIIFSQYTETIDTLFSMIPNAVKLTGTSTMEERQQAVDEFQTLPDVKVFIGNMKAAGVGINLTAASIVVFADMEWTPGIHDQAEDRAHRIGTEGTVNVYYYVVKDTIEEDIVAVLEEKRGIVEEIIEGKKSVGGSVSAEILTRLKARIEKNGQK